MYMGMPYQNMDLQATRSSVWYNVPMAPQEPNLNLLLMMIQMLSQMKKFQYQPVSTSYLQQPVELDIQSMILRSHQRSSVTDELVKSQDPQEETRVIFPGKSDESEIYEDLPSDEAEVQQNIRKTSENSEEKDTLLKRTTEEVQDLTAENERIKNELKIIKEELENCRKSKEEEIKCNSIDSLHQVNVLGPVAGWYSVGLDKSFRPGSKIVIRGRAENTVPRLNFNFKYPEGIALHIDNRWNYLDSEEKVVMNTNIKDSWGQEVIVTPTKIERGQDFVISVQSEKEEFKICVNGSPFATYSHRVDPAMITTVDITGAAEITSVNYQGVEEQESTVDDESFPSDQDDLDEFLGYYLGVR